MSRKDTKRVILKADKDCRGKMYLGLQAAREYEENLMKGNDRGRANAKVWKSELHRVTVHHTAKSIIANVELDKDKVVIQ